VTTTDEFDVRVERTAEGPAVVHVAGDLDLAASPQLEAALASTEDVQHLVLHLGDCTFLDSSGVRVIARAARETSARGARLDLVAVDPAILRVLEITGVDTMAPVHASLDDVR